MRCLNIFLEVYALYFIYSPNSSFASNIVLSFVIIITHNLSMYVSSFDKIFPPRVQLRAIYKLMPLNFAFYAFRVAEPALFVD